MRFMPPTVPGKRLFFEAARVVCPKLSKHKAMIQMYLRENKGVELVDGGETGIRTLDTLRYTRFPSVRLQPLGHLSAVGRTV